MRLRCLFRGHTWNEAERKWFRYMPEWMVQAYGMGPLQEDGIAPQKTRITFRCGVCGKYKQIELEGRVDH